MDGAAETVGLTVEEMRAAATPGGSNWKRKMIIDGNETLTF